MALSSPAPSRSARSAWRTEIICPMTYLHNEAHLLAPTVTIRCRRFDQNFSSPGTENHQTPLQLLCLDRDGSPAIVCHKHHQPGGNGGGCRGVAEEPGPGTVRGGIPREWRRCRGFADTDGRGAQGHRYQFNPPPPAPAGGDRQTSE